MTKSVAILGCGPAGLLVAHAASLSGWDFRVYSKKAQSQLYGAQYLHAAIPGLECGIPRTVTYKLKGTPESYRRKVYGEDWDGTVSPEDYLEEHYAWDIRMAYRQLWTMYQDQIEPLEITNPHFMESAIRMFGGHDLVISTVPRKLWAQDGDVFESQRVWALGDTEMPRVEKPYRPEPFSVICEGTRNVPWYRVSNIFGYCTIEWPQWWNQPFASVTPPHPGASVVEKPLRHNSTAASDFIHLGRYGKWEKGVLSTDAFFDAMKALADDAIG